jgi:hypothetical protein
MNKIHTRPAAAVRAICASLALIALAVICASPAHISAAAVSAVAVPAARTLPNAFDAASWTDASVGSISSGVLSIALSAASCAVQSGAAPNPGTLSVIDYTKPSAAERLWVFDVATHALLFHELVAHGSGSGANIATKFSNDNDSHQSSLGLFLTAESFIGKSGYALRLKGLEAGINDRAWDRAIVMHGASYVSEMLAKTWGQIGRSWGCPAVRLDVAKTLIDRVKGGGLIFAYYPDPKWLSTSKYLGTCATR